MIQVTCDELGIMDHGYDTVSVLLILFSIHPFHRSSMTHLLPYTELWRVPEKSLMCG